MASLDKNSEIFVMYIAILEILESALYFSLASLLAALQQDKDFTKILS